MQSRVYFTTANDGVLGVTGYPEQQRSYGLVNAHLAWVSESELWKVVVSGSNILDKDYILGTANYTAAIAGRPGRPRVVTATLSRRF